MNIFTVINIDINITSFDAESTRQEGHTFAKFF